jgi:hypothetical protein
MDVELSRWKHRRMGIAWFGTMIDCRDPDSLAAFWREVLEYVVVFRSDALVAIAATRETRPGLGFLRVDSPKHSKNRIHLELEPDDQQAEVDRLLALGATRVDIGQGDVSWVVMADPEGNEFCVLAH